jgi:hypothetical protein
MTSITADTTITSFLEKLLKDIDARDQGAAILSGNEILKEFGIENKELSENLSVEVQGFCQNYFFIYLELLHLADSKFIEIVSSPDATKESYEENKKFFLEAIQKIPESLLKYLIEKNNKKWIPQKFSDDDIKKVLDQLVKNLNKISSNLSDHIRTVFGAAEDRIANRVLEYLALNPENKNDQLLIYNVAQVIHNWVEEKGAIIDERVKLLGTQLTSESKSPSSSIKIQPLESKDLSDLIVRHYLFLPAFISRAQTIPSILLIASLQELLKDRNNFELNLKFNQYCYDVAPHELDKFAKIIDRANRMVFAIQQLVNFEGQSYKVNS